ncbi:gamma-interferon-inducible lysosomal thiol reductase-like [Prorops nasuta]|uniref:gamma-interferon-inducible lysosomal thiol reductase-like n=1 Tax=Prorops nasuta TaxID=863751 RepID=UPI0034D006B6
MKWKLIVPLGIICCQAFLLASNELNNTRLNVDIYYDVRNYRSRDFFKYQFLKSYEDVKDYIKVTLIPYHYTMIASNSAFSCPNEHPGCFDGEFHACAADQLDPEDYNTYKVLTTVNLFYCALSIKVSDISFYKCAEIVGMDKGIIKDIGQCVEWGAGYMLITKYNLKMRALKTTIVFTPTVVINGVYTRANHIMGRNNFFKLICTNLRPYHRPDKCRG